MFWVIKSFFKGDPEFTYEGFYSLPYEYVYSAYVRVAKHRQLELHEYEQPLALQTCQTANMNRDPKKQKTAFTLEDFYMFQPRDMAMVPSERYGAAAIYLVEHDQFPAWALFCFRELKKGAGGQAPPLVAFVGPGAILLAPQQTDAGWRGMLIASAESADTDVQMTSPCGRSTVLHIPAIEGQVAAEEGVELREVIR